MARSETEKHRARNFVLRKMHENGLDEVTLVQRSKLDRGTVRTFLAGTTFPQKGGRTAIEDVIGVPHGTIELVAAGLEVDSPTDPVTRAIEDSALSRGDKSKLIGWYYDLLDAQQSSDVS